MGFSLSFSKSNYICTSYMKCNVFINPFSNKPWFFMFLHHVFCNTGKQKKLLVTSNFSFSHSAFYPFGEFSSNLKLSSAKPFSLEESKICHSGKS